MRRLASVASLAVLAVLALLGGCSEPEFSDAEKKTIASLALNTLPALKADTTNQYADVPAAAALGSTLFFDAGMSRDGTVSCSTCHK
ncbi:cytochrome c peroxidase, partial [Mesorhizobium sp.]